MKQRRYSQGAELTQNGVSFRTWATDKKSVSVVLLNAEKQLVRELPMNQEPGGYYSVEDPQATAGMLYQYRLDGQLLPDPASRFQPFGVHGPSQVINNSAFVWTDQGWTPPPSTELVIYELHIGTFTDSGSIRSINQHIHQFLPVSVHTREVMTI